MFVPIYTELSMDLPKLVSVAEADFVILSEAKDLDMAQILRFAQNDMGWLPIFRNKNKLEHLSARTGLTPTSAPCSNPASAIR
jgi:hypothetical protein